MVMLISELRKPLKGPTGGMLIGQSKLMRLTGYPDTVTGLYFGLKEGSLLLVKRTIEHTITDMRFIKTIYGNDTLLTSVVLPVIASIPYLTPSEYSPEQDPGDVLYTRIF